MSSVRELLERYAEELSDLRRRVSWLETREPLNVLKTETELAFTISSGAITVPTISHPSIRQCTVATEGGTPTDNLDQIDGGVVGDILIIRCDYFATSITVRDSVSNLYLTGDFTMDPLVDTLVLFKHGIGVWVELSRADT